MFTARVMDPSSSPEITSILKMNACYSAASIIMGSSWHKESINRVRQQVQVGCEEVRNCPGPLRSKKTVAEQNSILKLCRK